MTVVRKPLYDTDPHAWFEQQAALLRAGRLDELDAANLAEELESLARSEREKVRSGLRLILMHLLKWCYQPERRSRSWRLTIGRERLNLDAVLDDNPSLKPKLPEDFVRAYAYARREAALETGLPLDKLPETSPFTLEQARQDGWLPD